MCVCLSINKPNYWINNPLIVSSNVNDLSLLQARKYIYCYLQPYTNAFVLGLFTLSSRSHLYLIQWEPSRSLVFDTETRSVVETRTSYRFSTQDITVSSTLYQSIKKKIIFSFIAHRRRPLWLPAPASHLYWYSENSLILSSEPHPTVSSLFNLIYYTNENLILSVIAIVVPCDRLPAQWLSCLILACIDTVRTYALPTSCQVCCSYAHAQVVLQLTSPIASFTFLFNEQFYTSNHSDFPSTLPPWSSLPDNPSPQQLRDQLPYSLDLTCIDTVSHCCGPLY
jgi:hypothetical protein